MWMTELYSPRSESELLVLRSVFDAAGLHYFVKNDLFGSLAVGPQIDHYNRKTVYVAAEDLDEARLLVLEFLERTAEPADLPREPLGLKDVLRMTVELLLFGWFMPGRRARLREPELRAMDGGGEAQETADDTADDARARFRLLQGGASPEPPSAEDPRS
jgi:hypothetical protein